MNQNNRQEQSSYRDILKATSIFGGVQVFNIAISIIRSKVIAVLLGPTGMGIIGLLTSTLGLIASATNFGIGTSAVKDIAGAYATKDTVRISTIVGVFRKLVWITGILGAIVGLMLSSWLSQITFGNREYTIAFIWISITLLFNQLSSGQLVILQGMRKLSLLAKANLAGSSIGLVITIPFYYKFGLDGIVPGIIVTALVTMLASIYYSQKEKIKITNVSSTTAIIEGKKMLHMGFIINISILLAIGASYLVRVFIRYTGNIEQVGLYNAGFAIINTYVGLIFTAMGTDYYPRLSAVSHSNKLSKETINQQAEIALLILAPILIVFLVFIDAIIILLYSKQFIAINEMIYWAALGMFFKAASWSISFIFLAKGTGQLFFWNELASNIYTLGLNILGYYYYGLAGLGFSFLIGYLIYLIQVFIICKIKFDFSFYREFIYMFLFQFFLASASFVVIKYLRHPYTYLAGLMLLLISSIYSYRELDKRIGLREIISDLTNRYK